MASGDSLITLDALSNRPPATGFAAVNVRGGFVVLQFDDSLDEQALFHATIPSHYGGGDVEVVLTWTTTSATSGSCKLRVELTRMTSGSNLDSPPTVSDSVEVTENAPATSGDLVQSFCGPLSVTGLSGGDTLIVSVTRVASDAIDTLAGDVELISVALREV